MRRFIIHLLATALLIGSASTASAIALSISAPDGLSVLAGGQIKVEVSLDTEGTTGITLLSTGVLFPSAVVNYNLGASSAPTYILYVNGKTPYMQPAANPPELRFGETNQVNVDYVATNLTTGTGGTGSDLMATLVFDVPVGTADGPLDISLSITSPGNVVQLTTGPTTATLSPTLTFIVPEPGLASLSMAALLTLGELRARTRKQQS